MLPARKVVGGSERTLGKRKRTVPRTRPSDERASAVMPAENQVTAVRNERRVGALAAAAAGLGGGATAGLGAAVTAVVGVALTGGVAVTPVGGTAGAGVCGAGGLGTFSPSGWLGSAMALRGREG